MEDRKYMLCSTCANLVLLNETSLCLACQRGFLGIPQEDDANAFMLVDLKQKEKILENALQEPETAGLDARERTGDGQALGSGNATPKKIAKDGKIKGKKAKRKVKHDA